MPQGWSGCLVGTRYLPGRGGTSGSHSSCGSSTGHLEGPPFLKTQISSFGGKVLAHLRIRSQPPSPPAESLLVSEGPGANCYPHPAPDSENCSSVGGQAEPWELYPDLVSDPKQDEYQLCRHAERALVTVNTYEEADRSQNTVGPQIILDASTAPTLPFTSINAPGAGYNYCYLMLRGSNLNSIIFQPLTTEPPNHHFLVKQAGAFKDQLIKMLPL